VVRPRYILDTNVLSEPLKREPHSRIIAHLKRYSEALTTAAPVWHELTLGVSRMPASKRREQFQEYLDTAILGALPILPYDIHPCRQHSER
jgi:tRNA(fMet)-specific endonuclease VapC